MHVALALLILVTVLLSAEILVIRRKVARIPVRIHVNGTRGKSSVTAYIAAGLRACGFHPLAKITGVIPTVIFPDGSTRILRRPGRARVQEQVHMIARASGANADALVLECMSITPALQRLEARILRPTIGVMTNMLDDHREEMGRSEREWVASLSSSIPQNAFLVTDEKRHRAELEKRAHAMNTQLIEAAELCPEDLSRIPPGAMSENVRLALAACRLAGCDATSALDAIIAECARSQDVPYEWCSGRAQLVFLDGFAVNDTPSASRFVARWEKHLGGWDEVIVILNTRSDRPLRSGQFARWIPAIPGLARVVLTGNHVPYARRILHEAGVEFSRIDSWGRVELAHPGELLGRMASGRCVVIGIGNIAGAGFVIRKALRDGH